MSITAIIPVRAGSTRVKNKNIKPFCGSNLLITKIHQLQRVEKIDNIVVSSDSDEMLEMAKNEGCIIQRRPYEYCDEKTKSFNEVVEYVVDNSVGDIMIWAPCVCPNCDEKCFEKGISSYFEQIRNGYDSVVSGKSFKEYLFDENGPHNYSTEKHVKSQDLPNWKTIVNGFYIASKGLMVKRKYFFGYKPFIVELSKMEAIDIDDPIDFDFAEFVYKKKYDTWGGYKILYFEYFPYEKVA